MTTITIERASVEKWLEGFVNCDSNKDFVGYAIKAATMFRAALAAPATESDERAKELETELAATEVAIAEYRQQCLDNAAEVARLKAESEERLQNCAALVAENERLRAAQATAPAQPARRPMTDADIEAAARRSGATAYTNRFVNGSAFSFGPEALREFVRAVESFKGTP